MRFWDSSALVPLFIEQLATPRVRDVFAADGAVATWWAAPVECASSFARMQREGRLEPPQFHDALVRMRIAQAAWTELGPSADVREQAIRLVRVHDLRAGGALQLAAAIVVADFRPASLEFVTLDTRQAEAADKEGFRLIS